MKKWKEIEIIYLVSDLFHEMDTASSFLLGYLEDTYCCDISIMNILWLLCMIVWKS